MMPSPWTITTLCVQCRPLLSPSLALMAKSPVSDSFDQQKRILHHSECFCMSLKRLKAINLEQYENNDKNTVVLCAQMWSRRKLQVTHILKTVITR